MTSKLASLTVLLVLGLVTPSAVAQTIPELARTKPENPIIRGVLRDIPAMPIEDLAKGADLVVQARVSRIKSYLSPSEEDILTDYQIIPVRVLVGSVAGVRGTPGPSAPLVLSVYGGELTIDGVTVRAVDHNLAELKPGAQFLLFLERFGREAGHYQLYNGGAFEIQADRLKPLLSRAEHVYRNIADKPIQEILRQIENAARK